MSKGSKHQSLINNREVRVFISSTFRDMFAEREELAKFTFPELRKRCRERQVEFTEVDLRWGISDEQKAEGNVLSICLAEIERCRPYFIGVLGGRYGWVPDDIDEDIEEMQPWLKEYKENSVTELEILHGVLKNPAMEKQSFFYFRDPKISKQVEEKLAKEADYQIEPTASHVKLKLLKEQIVAHEKNYPVPVRKDFSATKTFGKMVLEDLWEVIDNNFPEKDIPSLLEREQMRHEAFVQSRARVYIGRDEYFKRLDDHVESSDSPLVILGESGSGKSALIANWANTYRDNHPDDFLLMHFIGASPYSADWAAMLRRIMGEFKQKFNIQQDIPDKPDELKSAFANWLHMAAAKDRIILIFDALNQLEDRDGAPDLVWLPPVIPSNVRLILSTLPGRPLEDLKNRDWPVFTVQPLDHEERKQFIGQYLAQYAKTLSSDRVVRITTVEPATNPLYLQALLEELRLFGQHEELDERINYYLEAQSVSTLYGKILKRYEDDFERDRPGLVKDAMSMLWASRHGLSEHELLDMLGVKGQPLERAVWTPLYLGTEHSLMSCSGLITFGHDYFREAVHDRFLAKTNAEKLEHQQLVDYFAASVLDSRKVDELPWQLMRTEAWSELAELLQDLLFLDMAWKGGYFELEMLWSEIELHSEITARKTYEQFLETPGELQDQCLQIARLLRDFAYQKEHLNAPLRFCDYLIQREQTKGNTNILRRALAEKEVLLFGLGEFQTNLQAARELEVLARESGDQHILQLALDAQGCCLEKLGDINNALERHTLAEEVCRSSNNQVGLQCVLGNKATLLINQSRFSEAMPLLIEAEAICRSIGHVDGMIASMLKRSILLATLESKSQKLTVSLQLLDEVESMSRSYNRTASLIEALEIKSQYLLHNGSADANKGNYGRAVEIFRQQERVCRDLQAYRKMTNVDLRGAANLIACEINYAVSLTQNKGDENEILSLIDEAQKVAKRYSLRSELSQVEHMAHIIRQHLTYRKELAAWSALPGWKRKFTGKPKAPEEQFVL